MMAEGETEIRNHRARSFIFLFLPGTMKETFLGVPSTLSCDSVLGYSSQILYSSLQNPPIVLGKEDFPLLFLPNNCLSLINRPSAVPLAACQWDVC